MRALVVAVSLSLAPGPQLLGAQAQPAVPGRDTVVTTPLDRIVAVVGDRPILWSEVLVQVNQRRARGMQVPTDEAGQLRVAREIVDDMADEEVMVQRAVRDTAVKVSEGDITDQLERQLKSLRGRFKTDAEFAAAVKQEGFGNPEEYRRWLSDQIRRQLTIQSYISHMRQQGKVPAVPVSEEDVTKAFTEQRGQLPRRPPTVTFRQIVVPARPSEQAKAVARLKAESLLVEIRRGGDFEQVAKRESMDSSSRELGGDLGWNPRDKMVEPFNSVMFSLRPGVVSPVIETTFGFHIIRVDRVRPGEVKARHILIRPKIDSADITAAKVRADSVLAQWKAGVPFDTLVARYHDPDEERGSLEPFPREQLPPSYQRAFEGKGTDELIEPFEIADAARDARKYVVARIANASEGGEYTLAEFRTQLRDTLSEQRAMRRFIDELRKQTYVSIRL